MDKDLKENNLEGQEKADYLELDKLEGHINIISQSIFEIEKIFNEKLIYILAGTLALLLQANQNTDLFNWIYCFGVLYLTLALLINLWGLFVSIDLFKTYKKVAEHNYNNYYHIEKQIDYPDTNLILRMREATLVFLTSGVILLVIYYLTY